jgi:cobalt-zinc-cadmium efflux system membrane fusion protein
MSTHARLSIRWSALVGGAVALLAMGAGATYISLRSGVPSLPSGDRGATTSMQPSGPTADSTPLPPPRIRPDVAVTLDEDAVDRAGITVTPVTAGTVTGGGLRAPGVVEPNAYEAVVVTPLVSGRVTSVDVELGDHVRRGQTIAQVFSPELARAQTRYVSDQAQLGAHEHEVARTETLVQIGAASREEIERIHAAHTAHRADVQTAASQLELLGLSASAIEQLGPGTPITSLTHVPAPIAGVVTERVANVGLNVDQTTKLFTVVDLSTVWVVAELYEKDFARVRVGTAATISTSAYPDQVLRSRVSYIDPQVSPATRTAKVRLEVPNAREELRLGMYAEVLFGVEQSGSTPTIPREAVQHVGDRSVVYLVDPEQPGTFVERDVRLGSTVGDHVAVVAGVQRGDLVVAGGSFHVRAEIERLGLRSSATVGGAGPVAGGRELQAEPLTQTARVVVGEQAFEPATVNLRAGVPARVTFLRTADATCATEVVFPSLGIRRALPLNEPVVISFTPTTAGEIAFACGMNMLKGVVVAR